MLEPLLLFSLVLNAGLFWIAFAFARDSFKKSIQIGQLLAEMDRKRAKKLEKWGNIGNSP